MESKELFFYELEGRGYIFQNKTWNESKHGFEDDMLNMAWEMWSSTKSQKVAVPEPTKEVICAIENTVEDQLIASGITSDPFRLDGEKIYKAMIEAQEPSHD